MADTSLLFVSTLKNGTLRIIQTLIKNQKKKSDSAEKSTGMVSLSSFDSIPCQQPAPNLSTSFLSVTKLKYSLWMKFNLM